MKENLEFAEPGVHLRARIRRFKDCLIEGLKVTGNTMRYDTVSELVYLTSLFNGWGLMNDGSSAGQ